MVNAIIVEDEEKSAENLKILIEEYCSDVSIIGIARSIREAVDLIHSASPDLVFLDINLKGESGFDLFIQIRKISFAVIFTTAYSNYALQAFRVAALDYLLKPINIEHLREAIARAKQIKLQGLNAKIENLLDHISLDNTANKLALTTTNGVYFINTEDIVYCEADSNYTIFHLSQGEKYTASKTLKSFEGVLPPNLFLRIHHSHVINLKYVKKYNRSESTVTMYNNLELTVSKRKQDDFLLKVGLR